MDEQVDERSNLVTEEHVVTVVIATLTGKSKDIAGVAEGPREKKSICQRCVNARRCVSSFCVCVFLFFYFMMNKLCENTH